MNRLLLLLLGLLAGFALAVLVLRAGLLEGDVRDTPAARAGDSGAERAGTGADDDDDAHGAGPGADDDDDDVPARVVITGGARLVRLDAAEQALAGIRVERLPVATVTPETHTVGVVADHRALAAAHADLSRALERRAAQAATAAAVGERHARLRALAAGGRLGAAREIADLELAARRERERTLELDASSAAAAQALVAQWGEGLVDATAPGSALAAELAAGSMALVTFAVPGGAPLAGVHVGRAGERAGAWPARVVAPAPGVLAHTTGASWHAVAAAPGLRHGMTVDVWVESTREPLAGALLPATAVVWHGGRRWYFVARGDGLFERQALPAQPAGLAQALLPAAAADVAVVTRGAQTLLAEEFRGAIPDEDDD
ncbi:MAG: hypothetical protein RLW62_01775 [Gammaproteobacteria bacterium]